MSNRSRGSMVLDCILNVAWVDITGIFRTVYTSLTNGQHTHIALVTSARNICTQGDFFFYNSHFIGNFHVHLFENICCVCFFYVFYIIRSLHGNNNGNI